MKEIDQTRMTTKTEERVITLLPGQAALLTDFNASLLAAIAGTGGGKTMLGYWWLHSRMEAYPGSTWAMAEPTYKMLDRIILNSSDPGRPSLFEHFQQVGHHPRWIDKTSLIMETDWGKLYLGSADNPDSMQGAAVKGYWLDESGQMKQLAHDTARQRCAMMLGQVLHTTTPYNLGALKTEIWDRRNEPGIHVETWRSVDRPGFPRASYDEERARLPAWRFAMMYDGRFERPAGLVHDSFGPEDIVNDFPIPLQWPIYVGHDFGIANPAALFTAQNPTTGELFYWHEYLPGSGKSPYDHVQAWQQVVKGYNVIAKVGGNHQEQETRDAYTAQGWHIIEPRQRSVTEQVLRVIGQERLHKIKVMRSLRHIIEEKQTFSYKLDERYNPTDKFEEDQSYHLSACERYLHTYFTPETVVRRDGMSRVSISERHESPLRESGVGRVSLDYRR